MTRARGRTSLCLMLLSSCWLPRHVCIYFNIEEDNTVSHLLFEGNLICSLTSVILESGWTLFYVWNFGLLFWIFRVFLSLFAGVSLC